MCKSARTQPNLEHKENLSSQYMVYMRDGYHPWMLYDYACSRWFECVGEQVDSQRISVGNSQWLREIRDAVLCEYADEPLPITTEQMVQLAVLTYVPWLAARMRGSAT